jgi:hypothetical protein
MFPAKAYSTHRKKSPTENIFTFAESWGRIGEPSLVAITNCGLVLNTSLAPQPII